MSLSKRMNRKIILSAFTLVVVAGIAVLSLSNKDIVTDAYYLIGTALGGDPDWIELHDIYIFKCGHIFAYFLMTFLLFSCGFFGTFLSAFIVLSIGVVFEFLQMLTPGRQTLFYDLGYNTSGIIAALVCMWIWKLITQLHHENGGENEQV